MSKLDELSVLNAQIAELTAELRERQHVMGKLRQARAVLICPFKVGDTITYRYGTGRRTALINGIEPDAVWDYVLAVRPVLKSGGFGEMVRVWNVGTAQKVSE